MPIVVLATYERHATPRVTLIPLVSLHALDYLAGMSEMEEKDWRRQFLLARLSEHPNEELRRCLVELTAQQSGIPASWFNPDAIYRAIFGADLSEGSPLAKDIKTLVLEMHDTIALTEGCKPGHVRVYRNLKKRNVPGLTLKLVRRITGVGKPGRRPRSE
jgi:hypothetical protein